MEKILSKKTIIIVSIVMAIFIATVTVLGLSCAGRSKAVGKYKFNALYYEIYNNNMGIAEIGDNYDGQKLNKDSYVLELHNDNTFDFAIIGGITYGGVWEQYDEYSIRLYLDGEILSGSLNGRNIFIAINNENCLILSK